MSICPNINLQEWKDLEASVGKFNAYKYFIETGGKIGTPEEVKSILNSRASYQLRTAQDKVDQAAVERIESLTERIAEKFDGLYEFVEEPDANWKGKLEKRDDKDVVVINTALATLDTPLHEFGHIFVSMIRKTNMDLYRQLKKKIESDYSDLLEETKILYKDQYTEPDQFIEEAMVQLLGELAAGRIKEGSSDYNFVQSIWESIVKAIQSFFGKHKDIIDPAYINSSITISELANLLANDSKIQMGAALFLDQQQKYIDDLDHQIYDIESQVLRYDRDVEYNREEGKSYFVGFKNTDSPIYDKTDKYSKVIDRENGKAIIAPKEFINRIFEFQGINFNTGQAPPIGRIGGPLVGLIEYAESEEFQKDSKELQNKLEELFIDKGHLTVNDGDAYQKAYEEQTEFAEEFQFNPRWRKLGRLLHMKLPNSSNRKPIITYLNRILRFYDAATHNMEIKNVIEDMKGLPYLLKARKDVYTKDRGAFVVDVLKDNYGLRHLLSQNRLGYKNAEGRRLAPNLVPESQQPFLGYNWVRQFENQTQFDFSFLPQFSTEVDRDNLTADVRTLLTKHLYRLNDTISKIRRDPYSTITAEGNATDLTNKVVPIENVWNPFKNKFETEEVQIAAGYSIGPLTDKKTEIFRNIGVSFKSSIGVFDDTYVLNDLPKAQAYSEERLWYERPIISFKKQTRAFTFNDIASEIAAPGSLSLLKDTPDSIHLEVLAPGGFEELNPTFSNGGKEFEDYLNELFPGWSRSKNRTSYVMVDENTNEDVEDIITRDVIIIPQEHRDKLGLVSALPERANYIQREVLRGIQELNFRYDNVEIIKNAPVTASITSPTGQIKRAMLYQTWARQQYGDSAMVMLKTTGDFVPYQQLKDEYKNLTDMEKKIIVDRINFKNRDVSGATQIRLKTLKERDYVFTRIEEGVIYVPENYRGRFMSPQEGKPIYQLANANKKDVSMSKNPSLAEIASKTQDRANDTIATGDQLRNTKAIEVANKLSEILGISYEMVSSEQATEITKNAKNPWNGESAFFYGNKVYFIADRLTTDLALHEFSHPLVRHLSKTDNAAFKKLFDDLAKTEEGQVIIDEVLEKYQDLDPKSDYFKEEVIVRALASDAMKKMDNLKQDSKFKSFIKNLLFKIKQMLRQAFGKSIPVSKIESITKLNELSDILVKGGKIEIQTELISDEEFAAYNRDEYEGINEDLEKIRNQDIQNQINTFYDIVSKQINMLLKNESFDELADILTDENQRGDLQAMRSNLSQWQTAVANLAEEFKADVNESRNRVEALSNTLFRLETVMEKVLEHVEDISQYPDTQENMHKAFYYEHFVDYWIKFIDDFKKITDDPANRVPARSPLNGLLEDTARSLRQTKNYINQMNADGARDAVYEQLEPINRTLRERYEKIISDMRKREAPQESIDAIFKEYHGMTEAEYNTMNELLAAKKKDGLGIADQEKLDKLMSLQQKGLSISKDKIEAILKGNMGDANWYNSYLEGYLYNTDPVIGGMALYTKNALNDVMIVSQAKANDFMEAMRPLLEKAGYNPLKIAELGEKLGFEDKVAKWNRETGEFEERKVWTFLNKFKDYRYDQDKLAREVDNAQRQYALSNTPENKKVLVDAIAAQKKFERDYMHQEYVPEFYERYELLETDDIGKEAAYRREKFFEDLRKLTEPAKTQTDQMLIADEIADLWREYRQMHSSYDLNGKLKKEREAEIAKRLRDFKKKSHDFYEWKIRKGVFENAYLDFLQELRNEGLVEGSDNWDARVDQWKKRNSRKVIKNEWYERRNEILDEIGEIMSKVQDPEQRKKIDQGEVWDNIMQQTSGFRDEDNQIIATDMTPQALASIKKLQEKLEQMKNEETLQSGLTRQETERMYELIRKQKEKGRLDTSDWNELQGYYKTKDIKGLSSADVATLKGLYQELSEITQREATPYYVDIMNNWLSKLNTDVMFNKYKVRNVTEVNASTILDAQVIESLLGQDAEFDKWFEANHLTTSYKKKVGGKLVNIIDHKRIYVWNVIKPADSNLMESYDIKDSSGQVIDTIEGLPALDYYARVVKSEYRTRRIVNETVDNRGRFLPKSAEDSPKDSKYLNEDYEKMRTEDPNLFAVLEKMKEFHLKHQEGLSYKSRLYLDYPRFVKRGLEMWQSKTVTEHGREKWNGLSQFIQRVKDFLYGDKERAEDGFNYDQNFNLVRADMFDNEITDIPIAGLYDVDSEDVSLDITHNMMRYMLSAERQKQLVKISPVVKAIQSTLKENKVYDLDKVNEAEFKNRGILRYLPSKKNVRLSAVNNFIQREFEGKTQASEVANTPWLNNFSNLLFKRASFSFFALNIPSALKNSLGMKFQSMIEASGGQFVDHVSLQKGNAWAYKAMGEMSFNGQLYKTGAKSHNLQLIEIFDPVQGRFEERIGESTSRTIIKDAAEFSWLYSPRKWVETQATLQLFGGIMYKKTLKVGDDEIKYIDAFETVDGQIRLKEGIDVRYDTKETIHYVKSGDTIKDIAKQYNIPESEIEDVFANANLSEKLEALKDIEADRQDALSEIEDLDSIEDEYKRLKVQDRIDAINRKYDKRIDKKATIKINNSEFKYTKNQIQQVVNNMGGAYAKFDQPEAQRYLAFRFISYLRRYFTTMAINRWGFSGPIWDPKPRLNPGMGDVQMGFYIQFMKTMIQTIRQGGQNLKYLTDAEKTAALKFFSEVGFLMLTTMLMSLLFGWDPEDDERYTKLREKSGALAFPFTTEDPDREFDMLGYAEVHALHMLMQVRAENEQFNLLTGGLKQYNSLLDIKSVAFGPTTDSYIQLWEDTKAMASGDSKAYYSRDVGPYDWQQQGGSKFLTHLAKTVGLTGSSLDPAMAVQNFQTYQAKVRR
jgi:hypothetical protein